MYDIVITNISTESITLDEFTFLPQVATQVTFATGSETLAYMSKYIYAFADNAVYTVSINGVVTADLNPFINMIRYINTPQALGFASICGAFYFDLDVNKFCIKNPLDGKLYAIQATEVT